MEYLKFGQFLGEVDNVPELVEEPPVNLGELIQPVNGVAGP